ncbi:MAG: hypothetical protein ACKO37_06745 [Vampirovibrionales bacterium]
MSLLVTLLSPLWPYASTIQTLEMASTWFMVGLIWFVQIVHYPLMAHVPPEAFPAYERLHCQLTTYVVMPVMCLELACSVLRFTMDYVKWQEAMAGEGVGEIADAFPYRSALRLGLLLGVWGLTAFASVPSHGVLSTTWDAGVHAFLVKSNWGRTVLWTLRGYLLF